MAPSVPVPGLVPGSETLRVVPFPTTASKVIVADRATDGTISSSQSSSVYPFIPLEDAVLVTAIVRWGIRQQRAESGRFDDRFEGRQMTKPSLRLRPTEVSSTAPVAPSSFRF
jgi:hypothetical protein